MATIILPKSGSFEIQQKLCWETYKIELHQATIEIIELRGEGFLLVDEEGKLKGFPINEEATAMAVRAGALFIGDFIVGNAIFLTNEEFETTID